MKIYNQNVSPLTFNGREFRRYRAYFQGFDNKRCRNPRKRKYRLAWEKGKADGEILRNLFGDDLYQVPGSHDPSWK